MAELRPERCATCRCWDGPADGDPGDEGVCRRHAPRPAVLVGDEDHGDGTRFPLWPLTLGGDWCGEFQPKRGGAPTPP